jgi:hypothetical protein
VKGEYIDEVFEAAICVVELWNTAGSLHTMDDAVERLAKALKGED